MSTPLKKRAKKTRFWNADEKTWLDDQFKQKHEEIMAIPMVASHRDGGVKDLAQELLRTMPKELAGRMEGETVQDFEARSDLRCDVSGALSQDSLSDWSVASQAKGGGLSCEASRQSKEKRERWHRAQNHD